jgi:ABC-type phosphate transport system ATPase subunit
LKVITFLLDLNWALQNSIVSTLTGTAGHGKVTTIRNNGHLATRVNQVTSQHLVNPEKVFSPSLLIKFDLMKTSVNLSTPQDI